MKKKLVVLSMILVLVLSVVGCSKKNKEETKEQTNNNASATEEVVDSGDDKSETEEVADKVKVSVASLKGPTSMGLVKMMKENEANNIKNEYDWNMYTAADEIVPKVVKGEVDIALIPANLAAVLYQKTNQGISVIDVNTLGVLNVLEHGNEIQSISDLKGKTICMTGKATVPEYTLKYLLSANGLSENDVTIEFKAEAPEVIAYMSTDDSVVGILPQPFVTSALLQDEGLRIACSLTEEWDAVSENGASLTGVTIVRNDFLSEHKEAVDQFIQEHKESVDYVNANVDEAAQMIESYDIIKAPIAKKALADCNIVAISGGECKDKLSGFLEVLYNESPEAVGGSLPDGTFYYEYQN